MAMNKAEKARMAELESALAAAAIGAKLYDELQPMTRDEIEGAKIVVRPKHSSCGRTRQVALGYGFNDHIGSFSSRVYPMWSDGYSHGRGNHTGDNASQNMGHMYRTERDRQGAGRLGSAHCRAEGGIG